MKVLVSTSGGVDSSTAAALLLEKGFDCMGVFMITHDGAEKAQADAKRVAQKLGIELHVLDLREDFKLVLNYFENEYKQGRTPNPCVFCNRQIKFGRLWEFAKSKGTDMFATGHYAKVLKTPDGYGLYKGSDMAKDQSYALAMINNEVLQHVILPMGDYTKDQTRVLASQFDLGLEGKEESQEICFIPDDDYVSLLEARCPELVRKGNIVDSSGNILGEHNGVHRFTIGQRRGLRVAMGIPYYVVLLDAQSNTVTLGTKEEVMHNELTACDVNWLIDKPESSFRADVKIRYNSKGFPAIVTVQGDDAIVEFDEAVSAITPGQLAVFYFEDELGSRVLGGGWIDGVAGLCCDGD
jgi:tRNA-specific 2-thiouridylase